MYSPSEQSAVTRPDFWFSLIQFLSGVGSTQTVTSCEGYVIRKPTALPCMIRPLFRSRTSEQICFVVVVLFGWLVFCCCCCCFVVVVVVLFCVIVFDVFFVCFVVVVALGCFFVVAVVVVVVCIWLV